MIYIHSLGHSHPHNISETALLENLNNGTKDAWILERIGIQTRRTVLPLDYIAETRNQDTRAAIEASCYTKLESAKTAAEMASKYAGIETQQIGLVIAGGCSPDTVTPAEACTIAGALCLEVEAFDLNSACSSFGAHLYFLSRMQPDALPEFILLVSPENNTRTIDYNDRNTAVLWGDGTSAAVVSTRTPGRAKVVFSTMVSSPAAWEKVTIPRLGHFSQEGATVQTFAIKRTVKCYREIRKRYEHEAGNLYFIGHQANLKMLESVCERSGIAGEGRLFNVA